MRHGSVYDVEFDKLFIFTHWLTMTSTSSNLSFLQVKSEYEVPTPMRDGVVLRSNIFKPARPGRYPAILWRTPYNMKSNRANDLVRAGYAVMFQDMRGRYVSDGQFKSFMVPTDQHAEDGYDTVEWLAAQPWCDGNVGTFGTSYPGWAQWMTAKLHPPHLKCMAAFAIPVELTQLDYPGAFRPARRVHWLLNTIAPDLRKRAGMSEPHTPEQAAALWKTTGNDWLNMLPWSKLADHLPWPLKDEVAAWMKNPGQRLWKFDEAWQEIDVPNLEVTGWYDHCHGIEHLAGMQTCGRSESARNNTRLIIGPWNHATHGNRQVGLIDFGSAAALNINQLHLQWFDRWLKPEKQASNDNTQDTQLTQPEPAVSYFVIGESDDNAWRGATTWPPVETEKYQWHLSEHFALSNQPTDDIAKAGQSDQYEYDPSNPVPTQWSERLMTEPSDRRTLAHRTAILRYRTSPLENDLTIAGNPHVVLHVSSTAVDTDFFARLIDEKPDGQLLDLCMGMVRTRHRIALTQNDPITPGEIHELTIQLGSIACLFKQGHRIHLEITSSDFPNYDRNHNTNKPNLHDAELLIAKQQIHRSSVCPSRIVLPVLQSIS